jgi:RHS repeat-associated protein
VFEAPSKQTWSTGYSAEQDDDQNGNRTRRTVGTTVEDYFYGDDDELTEIKIGSTVVKSFGYDGAGRRTSATYAGVTTSYAYDYESRITSITRTGVTTNSFAYNGLDTRVSKTDSTGTTSYKRAGAYVTDSLLKSTVSSTTTDYTPGVPSRVGSDSTFLHSGIKNADTQTDDGGDVSAIRRYDAFGNPLSAWGGWQGPFGSGGPHGYQTDPDHGLMLLGHRYYEADTGRFLTRDPIKDGRNWYGYCDGNPLVSADSTGLQFQSIFGPEPGSHPADALEWHKETGFLFFIIEYNVPWWYDKGRKVTRQYTDCGSFVASIIRVSDPDVPRNSTTAIKKWLIDSWMWDPVTPPYKGGDVAIRKHGEGGHKYGHTAIRDKMGVWYESSLGNHGPRKREGGDQGLGIMDVYRRRSVPNLGKLVTRTIEDLRRGAG